MTHIAKLTEMGQITTVDLDGSTFEYPFALVVRFDSAEAIRAAIEAGECKFTFGAPESAESA